MNFSVVSEARTVSHLADHFEQLKQTAIRLADEVWPAERGYFLPSEEEAIRTLLVSYWKPRCALLELIQSLRSDDHLSEEDRPFAFLVAFAAALILIDAARFLRDSYHSDRHLRRMWNQPAPEFGIPGGTYDTVQKSLLSARHAWHLYHAWAYLEQHETLLRTGGLGTRDWNP